MSFVSPNWLAWPTASSSFGSAKQHVYQDGTYSFNSLVGGTGQTMEEEFDVTGDEVETQTWTTLTIKDEPVSYQ